MSKVLVTESYLNNIAEAIRSKNHAATTYRPGDMAQAIRDIETGITPTGTKQITANGTHDVTQYASANVQVPNTYEATDEGKVVSNGALIAQTSRMVTENGTYDTTENDEVVVNVSGGGGSANIEEWDLTQSLTGKLHSIDMTALGVAVSAEGVVFDSANDYLMIPISWNGITIEVDVATMNLASGTHRRFIMASESQGLIYRSTGVWGFYANGWATDSGENDGSFFDDCTVKVVVDVNGYWHIYKDGVLWWEPNVAQSMSGSARQIRIGSNGQSINNATITGVRLS